MTRKDWLLVFIASGLILTSCLGAITIFYRHYSPFLKVVFFDIGQGDAILIQMASFCQILIDGGPGRIISEKLSEEMPFYDKTIDLVILTHPEKDHMEGLISVLENYRVGKVVWTGVIRETGEYKVWQKALEDEIAEGAEIEIAKAGKTMFLDKGVLVFLSPLENFEGQTIKDSNKTSVVAKFAYGNVSFLFTGDILEKQEKELIESGLPIRSDILKIAHHGSKTSTSEQFLKAVLPKTAVISAGRNNFYGHPYQEVLRRLKKAGIEILRTDENGDIKMIRDPTSF